LVAKARQMGHRGGMVESFLQQFSLSTPEGLALMGLAEALLRTPDADTRDRLIAEKISAADWASHLGQSDSLLVNASTWGLMLTGRLIDVSGMDDASGTIRRLAARVGEPIVRAAVAQAVRIMGEQFVLGRSIEDAIARAARENLLCSFDMLGEGARTEADAVHYEAAYAAAIGAIGRSMAGPEHGHGISVKLSALSPRYEATQEARVWSELYPRLKKLAEMAAKADINFTIDAEEADRLVLSLKLLDRLTREPSLGAWRGLGLAVQAYQTRAVDVIPQLAALAKDSGRRLMVRLVKGAYWDSEIKRAQQEGLADYPVFTRKAHTDLCYLACARKLLAAQDAIFPQFATHNAQTLAAIRAMAGPLATADDLEFQCLHGMGEPLYREAFAQSLAPACRIYAPVGTHETLLAYLVRRLLENGANGSFVHRLQDPSVPVDALTREPAEEVMAEAEPGAPNTGIPLPRHLYGARRVNSAGLDLSDVTTLTALDALFQRPPQTPGETTWPVLIRNPADQREVVGGTRFCDAAAVGQAVSRAEAAAFAWGARPAAERAALLRAAADRFEAAMPSLLPLIIREAGKTVANAVAEVRETVDFLRYYAVGAEARDNAGPPLGPFACISPWNFPLAIFTGQVAAALVMGNPVLAKPAEETPLIAAAAIALLHQAGIPPEVLQLLPGAGDVGAALVTDPRIRGVAFTGSGEVAKRIEAALAERLNPGGRPVPLIAETGGLNAMIVDSSALPEQVVADVITSAFDSAGQRCSALRLLCLQKDIAGRLLPMLRGAMAELSVGNPWALATDIGPVISAEARAGIERHVTELQAAGFPVERSTLGGGTAEGFFVAPTLIHIRRAADLTREVFGPVLHVLTYEASARDALIAEINATGFALTAGVHSRIDSLVERAVDTLNVGNIYVNRNIVGATVGVQPFGGHGLSGTGPKAGGPLYLRRFLASAPPRNLPTAQRLPGPSGEENRYSLRPRHAILCATTESTERARQAAMATKQGAIAVLDQTEHAHFDAVLFSGDERTLSALLRRLAAQPGAIRPVFLAQSDGTYPAEAFVTERALSINTAAAGGSVELLTQVEAG
ncbi:MAG TPA: bifunctional proline dehydrogenase/L-glutamate gamma-semialdehyde dehydrogenase PutA, partial [Acidisoma sp.]|uniref:bifunctional proline dehydrogenase/L-glutamate gamma-semialdehyde dehydrogenase PutA n=1 Tax=Acidisoma sp. TaxID=1872115 RepID=UPI002C8D2DED